MNTHSFSFIIGYRHTIERLHNLKRVLDWINGFSNVDVILVEQDTHSKISHLNLKCRHIFIKSNAPYNRSWAFNIGIKNSKCEAIVFSDSDLIMNPNDFISAMKELENVEMVNPYKSVIDLQPQESLLPLEELLKIDRPGRGENDNQKINLCGGMSIFRKSSIRKIGGWNESFIGWGGEDDYQAIKVTNFLTYKELGFRCYHLFHNRENPDMKDYHKNLQILNQASTMSKEDLIKTINASLPKIGMSNKYDNF